MGKLLVLRPPEMAQEPKQNLPDHSAVARELVSRAARVLCSIYTAYGGRGIQAFLVDEEALHPWPAWDLLQGDPYLQHSVSWPGPQGTWGGAQR